MRRINADSEGAEAYTHRLYDGGVWHSVLIWLCILAAIALVAKNFGDISSPKDLLFFDRDTGQFVFFGESFVIGDKTYSAFESLAETLARFWISFTPARLFLRF